MEVAEEMLPIGIRLQFALFGLECALGVSFTGAECERIFRDAANDQVSAKTYRLFESPRLVVSGRVDEYEPDSIWLRVQGGRGVSDVVRRVVEGSEFHVTLDELLRGVTKDNIPGEWDTGPAADKEVW